MIVNNSQKFLFTAKAIPLKFGNPSDPIPTPTPLTPLALDLDLETLNELLDLWRLLLLEDRVGLIATAPGDLGTT